VRKRRDRYTPRLIVYAKAPKPGQVKTRLARAVGNGRAAEIYRAMLSGFLARLRSVKRRWHVSIHYTPADQETLLVPDVPQDVPRLPQCAGDLGARLKASFASAFAAGRDPCVICGTDSPDLPIAYLEEAIEELSSHDVVLGPTQDGGYYLVGLRAHLPQLFDGIPWSTEDVFRTTLSRAQALGRTVHTTPAWHDVDTLEDLREFLARDPGDPRTARIQNRVRATIQSLGDGQLAADAPPRAKPDPEPSEQD
jgi:rSAM/selenodomain-associated transferase 1